jgi:hypothetical protein
VFFQLVAPWTVKPVAVGSRSSSRSLAATIASAIFLGLFFTLPVVAVAIARYNLRRSRVDTRGATRIAVAMAILATIKVLVATQARLDPMDGFAFAAWPVLIALLAWCFYAAVEPSVRRGWPKMLISWSRLMEGRWRDPLVGRHLLIGSTMQAVALLASFGWQRFVESFGLIAGVGSNPPLLNLGSVVEAWAAVLQEGFFGAFGLALVLVLVRLVLRSERLALFGAMVSLVAIGSLGGGLAFVPDVLLFFGPPLFAIVRWGLLSVLAFMVVGILGVDFTLPEFASTAMVVSVALVLAPGVFGFYAATRGRTSSAWLER